LTGIRQKVANKFEEHNKTQQNSGAENQANGLIAWQRKCYDNHERQH
jgi:hypothetical protein